ncbi:Putative DNA ligase-like protein [Gemmata obscuriglobus]|uniref:hypothetical protein n=1 Tax=Gemmata obscuriglobus TaxID=114 RepID=UPI0002EF310C|nr:hypothetical protein [Gemmata obscuriglobus]QEG27264.1 Putative DNA ligase-like protein [Gemmata obscuriglobus]VTS04043.1 Uncharacterized protein OS=Singulisphaera acidiphila (strain ATCC BAA-1392 / DSM 18658 / VKM B-2454 / MOB10) GN=Sinac_6085 PE=4 SV=1: LigD_N [Gemmata obscuriglobus UQM 2246]
MTRFVVLTHDWPEPHFDLLVEEAGRLRAWRLLCEPQAGCDVPAAPNFPHRLVYLEYEGPLSGGRGSVSRWDVGTCVWEADEPHRVQLSILGTRLSGRAVIARRGDTWFFRLTGAGQPG